MTAAANLFTPARYDESITRLALGVELLDALDATETYAGGRYPHPVAVLDERHPAPLHRWRRWPAGVTLDDALTGPQQHRSGRFAWLLRGDLPAGDPQDEDRTVRIVEPRSGARRCLVPRRLRLRLFDDPPPDDPPDPLWHRIFRVGLFPGAGLELGGGASVLRGRVVRKDENGVPRPVRWARVVARDEHDDLGWAHGDDRGEFLLVLGIPAAAATMPTDPMQVELAVTVPPPVAVDPADVLLTTVDPLWDLPVQTVVAMSDPPPDSLTDPVLTGRGPWPGPELGPFGVSVPLGRETSVALELPAP